jgi:hypothetical protein
MDNDILLLLARALSQKGQLSQSQLSALFSPELGYLTGTTFEDTSGSAENEDLLKMQYAPNLRLVENLPDTDIRKRIARMIVVDGIAPWDVKATIEEYAAAQANANPETFNAQGETSDLMSFADTIFKENNALNVQLAQSSGVESDWSKKTGKLAPFTARYSAADLAPDYFSALAERLMQGQEEMRKIQAPGGQTLKSASKFIEQQGKELERTSRPVTGPRKFYGTSAKTFVEEEQLAPYVPAGTARTVKGRQYNPEDYDPEMTRFANVAKSIVSRGPQNKELSAQRADLLKRQQIMEKVGQDFAMKLEQTAEQLGFTPAMVDLLKRAQFLRVGGK